MQNRLCSIKLRQLFKFIRMDDGSKVINQKSDYESSLFYQLLMLIMLKMESLHRKILI